MNPSENISGTSACDPQRLDQFLQSDHYRIEDAELVAHLDVCPSCREHLESRAGDAEVWMSATTLLRPCEFDYASSHLFSAGGTVHDASRQPIVIQEVLDALAPTDHPHSLGRIGTHEVTGVVGVGGMGVVLKAIDPSLDRVVAVKVMAPRLANNETSRKRFAREAKAAAAVLHPNVVPIHGVSSDKALPYLVMAYIRGGSLQKRLEEQGPLPLVEILRIGAQIAAGLAAAHEQGLVHRDIKPENILLEEGVERVTITDFGLARAVDDHTVTQCGAIAGTPMYMSPEQARGDQLDQQSDLFSLGSVLYALSTGRPPYRADSSYGVMRRIIDESPAPIRSLNSEIPEWFAGIVEKLMSKNKADRFASASELHKLLEACLSHVQQPNGVALPHISCTNRQPHQPTVSGVYRMIKFSAGMMTMAMIAVVILNYGGIPESTPSISHGVSVEIDKSAQFEVTDINADLAERLIGRSEHVTFSKVTSLTPEVAVILANHPGNLSFPAMKHLTPEVAKAFAAKKEGLWIALRGLDAISPEVAQELAQAECAWDLGGVASMNPETAAILVSGNGTLSLGLRSMTPEVAERLALHKGWLSLNSLAVMDPEAADRLAEHKHWLSLNGLSAVTPEIASALGNFNGEKLELNGLESLNVETAKPLSRAHCRSGLYLNGLQTVTADVIQELANGNSHLSLQGLTAIDGDCRIALEAAREKLAIAGKILFLPSPKRLASEGPDAPVHNTNTIVP
ncbi:MAG: serine/threonine-protein kinase [Planctomycetaceae bacterium]|nr:serine/threonine-protein kinase [Planctomycetaceae bacterium]